jgi:hypothetical protein
MLAGVLVALSVAFFRDDMPTASTDPFVGMIIG